MAKTNTERKYAKLQSTRMSKQLVYPDDILNDPGNHGVVIVFEVNRVVGSKTDNKRTNIKGLESNKGGGRVQGAYGNEVAMQTSVGNGSWRSKDVTAKGVIGPGKIYQKTDESIVLPFTQNFQTTQNIMWNTTNLGALGRAADFVNSMGEDGREAWDQAKEGAVRAGAGALQGLGVANAKDALEISSGISANPYQEMMFQGVGNRVFPFMWTFVPRNRQEAEMVAAIIHRFRFHSLPELKSSKGELNSAYLIAPSTFDVSFINAKTGERVKSLPMVATCALTNITVNGTPNGEYVIGPDGHFVSCTLELMMTELITLQKESLNDMDNSY